MAREKQRVGVLDFETDPFLFGRVPMPFACGIYFAENDYKEIWGDDCIDNVVRVLRKMPRCILIAHNGGKFDFDYLVEDAIRGGGQIIIRNSRIVEMHIGEVTLKDSWPLMPFALEEFRKTPIDYSIFEADKRSKPRNKSKILAYLKDDCRNLLELYEGFRKAVGPKDTIGAAAFHQMRHTYGLEIMSCNEEHDEQFREYFFGGRTNAFKRGVFHGRFKYYDINSAYPFAMCAKHPHGPDYSHSRKLPRKLGAQFVECLATSHGALPIREDDGSIEFPNQKRIYFATGWEIAAGIETKTLTVHKVLNVWTPRNFICFDAFVADVFARKAQAKKDKDQIHYLAYKYLGNSGYGKFAQNPRDFREYMLMDFGDCPDEDEWEWETDWGQVSVWSRPSYDGRGFYDVATSASITGFVRGMIWRGIHRSKGVKYCDTDSLICDASSVPQGDKLGQWKRETCPICHKSDVITTLAIGGKKLYGLKWSCGHTVIHSKGARLTWSEILDVANGKTVTYRRDAPTFSATLGAYFIEREINAT